MNNLKKDNRLFEKSWYLHGKAVQEAMKTVRFPRLNFKDLYT